MIEGSMSLDAGQAGTIKGMLEAHRSTSRWQDMPLRGELNVQTAELGLITLYVPDIDRVAGKLVTDLSVSGTLGTPLLDGMLKLSDAELDLYQVNLAMRGAQLEARLAQNGLDFDGSANIGAGRVATNGHIEWRNAKPYGKLNHHRGEPAGRRRAGSTDRCLAATRLQDRRPSHRSHRRRESAVREDRTCGPHERRALVLR